MNNTPLALGAICAIGLGAGFSPADAGASVQAITIRMSDLDLSRRADAVELYSRISRAATQACGPFDTRSSYEQQRMQACVKSAIDAAVERVNQPQLVALARLARS